MRNKREKRKINKFVKPVIMPTTSILTHITVDGIPDNNMIKTTFIKKSKSNQKNKALIKNFMTGELISKKNFEIEINEDDSNFFKYDNENIETNFNNNQDTNYFNEDDSEDIEIEFNNNLNNAQSINYFGEDYEIMHESLRSKKINKVKNEFKINELRVLMSNINYELKNRITQKGKIVMNSNKFDENALYREFESNYECRCHSCQKLNLFKKDNKKNFKNIDGNKEKIQLKNDLKFREEDTTSLDNFVQEHNDYFNEDHKKFEKINLDKTIYSQSILNDLLINKICESKNEFLTIFNSLDKKKSFLYDLKNGKFGLNEANKIKVEKMIQRLIISEKEFINNNMNYFQRNVNHAK